MTNKDSKRMLILKKDLFDQIVRQCRNELPNEACGILAGKDSQVEKVFEMANAQKSPDFYFMDASQQLKVMKEIRGLGLEMLGIYHSHVASQAYPSAKDVELAFYPQVSYVILSFKEENDPQIKAFKIQENSIIEEEIQILGG